uniref:Ubiquitin carboxyl-terminal hydrolase n=1 Tax=Brugia malayi TaxID=6279 RepID=A0A1I9G0D2_BRUMA|nr:Bm5601 [Brugia malayi]
MSKGTSSKRRHGCKTLREQNDATSSYTRSSVTASRPLANLDDNNHCYVGLVNQAMTCYLNSLIQTLYMTPEFRNAIYGWKFTGSEAAEARSIPCQLQKLFLLLQTSDRESLETIDLTASFGWSNSEAYEQHDIQELCRIMFDALKQKWSKADASFQELYRGNMEDFVKCLFCQKENIKQDEFLDLPLAVKQFGATDAFKSVEEALHAFIKPEVLEGSNQYYCEGCRRKQNALKGLRIIKFPYLLSIQLKRFDFDCNTLHRIKLNDKMTFPALLNLNEFVYDATKSEPPKKISWASAVSVSRFFFISNNGHLDEQEVDMLLKRDGPFLYELFSVMVHQGSASGGHYFAYIKNMDQDKWFCFNDSNVTPASIEDIHRTFGGSCGGWSSGNTNAYMLMYRQIDRKRNARFIKTGELADHLLERLRRFEELEEEKLREKQYKESLVSVKLINYNCFICSSLFNCSIMIQIRRSDNYKCCKYYKNCEFISVLRFVIIINQELHYSIWNKTNALEQLFHRNVICLDVEVDVDDRQLVIHMKQWLSAVIGVDMNEFVVLKHYSTDDADGYESIINETETIHDAYYLSVKLRSPLKENEKLMRIIRFDRENWPTLFSIPTTVDMQIRTLLMRCQEQMKKVYATKYDLNQ